MLKRRIIPVELLLNGRLVKSRQFTDYRDVGDPVKSSKVYSDQDADELLLVNIGDSSTCFDELVMKVALVAKCCFVPLTAGGGIRTLEDACRLFEAGADKVSLCTAAYRNPELLRAIASRFGSQAVVVCIDVKREPDGTLNLHSERGLRPEQTSLADHLAHVANAGAGEIMVQSLDRDGLMAGYDIALIKEVAGLTALPVIALGGAGQIVHLKDAFDAGAEAAACGSLFNFGDNNPLRAKALLKNYGVPLKRI